MLIRSRLIFLAAAVFAGSVAYAQAPLNLTGDTAHGEELAYTCTGCHGVDSAVNVYPTYHVPKLGGQNADYLEIALLGYREGSRGHETMHAQASQLSDQDIADLAAWFASLEDQPTSGTSSAGADMVAQGQEKSTPCSACHGANGMAATDQWPNLAGQHATYLYEALLQYQRGDRTNAVMLPLVADLDEEELKQLAAFYASQEGLFQTGR